ncbi:fibrinogen-like protein 1-like protein [Rhinatrema bivittatum]|uniref:fibrinogen-like protein 1-like protein n=1 Tax=Rhinatrema bivittatum TaxID=194408 RepID=UPI00112B98F7|nr:fibrinogen-like protein 1-like protein [Rhinatrema bivittatum]
MSAILNYSPKNSVVYPEDCAEIPWGRQSGLYIIQPAVGHRLVVHCDMKKSGGGWTVIQRNSYNSKTNWNVPWESYKQGFGSPQGDHWLGNQPVHLLTSQKLYKVRFVLRDAIGVERFADYDSFSLEGELGCFRLRLGKYSGTAGDALTTDENHAMHDNMKFSTYDRDNDRAIGNCAARAGGGWWYDNCRFANLNTKTDIYWQGLCPGNCKSTEILIKPSHFCEEDGGGGENFREK